MASINDNIRGKKLFKEGGSGASASKGSDGEVTISKEKSDELTALTDISDVFNDDGLYQSNKFLLKQVEDLRADVEELHAFIKDAFGKDSSSAASQGAKGDTGAQGPKGNTGAQGPAGSNGTNGTNGSDGSDGSDGAKGDKGDTGSTGPQGIQGATGPQGATGAAGSNGADGADGAQGPQGIQGEKGDTGATGGRGPAGSDAAVSGFSGKKTVGKETWTFENGLLDSVGK